MLLARQVGVPYIVVALNKSDMVDDEEILELVELEVRELLGSQEFDEDAPVVQVSALTALDGDEKWVKSVQDLMAADRGNPNVAYLYQACDPAVLRALRSVIQAGVRAGIPVGLCGEMASDALLIPVLLGFGLERFSVSTSAILNTRREISRWSIQEAQEIADHALTLETAAQVAAYLNQVQER